MNLRQSSILATSLFAVFAAMAQSDSDSRRAEALALVQRFAATLKPELLQALESGGPAGAIEVCSERAPAIADELSASSGWKIYRVSSKPRNPQAAPEGWEVRALAALQQQLDAQGAEAPLVFAEQDEDEYRLAKGQLVAPLCIACHGKEISPEVQQALSRFYPHDLATGYEVGQLRGAIIAVKE